MKEMQPHVEKCGKQVVAGRSARDTSHDLPGEPMSKRVSLANARLFDADEPDLVRNRKLFADYFLDERLADMPQWADDTGIDEAFAEIDELFQQRAPGLSERTNEDQTEHDFIRPVLYILWRDQRPGDCYEVQADLPGDATRRQPDYAFFRNADERREARGTVSG